MWIVFVQPRHRGVFFGVSRLPSNELSKSIRGMTREVQKNLVFAIETGFDRKNIF